MHGYYEVDVALVHDVDDLRVVDLRVVDAVDVSSRRFSRRATPARADGRSHRELPRWK